MSPVLRCNIIGMLAAAVLLTGCGRKADTPPAEIAVTNSYLHAVVRDLCGDQTVIFSVVPPGMCPGHFDVKPSDVQRLFECRLLLAFDFQKGIGGVLPNDGRGPALHTIAAPPGLCIPDTYLQMTRQTADILIAEYPERQPFFQQRLEAIAERIAQLESQCRTASETLGLHDAPVLTSRHQEAFAQWLGLTVAATFTGRDAETAANINAALRQSDGPALRWVIANQQEGTQLAKAMADRLGAPVAVFSNFPAVLAVSADTPAFDEMVRGNLSQLAGNRQ